MSDHFYTTSAAERDQARNSGYESEGIAGYVHSAPQPGPVEFYRAFHPRSGDHFYTASRPEHDNAINNLGYQAEGVEGYISSSAIAGTTPLYRLHAPWSNDHFYTTSAGERNRAIAGGYRDEGISGYVHAAAGTGVVPFYRAYNKGNGDHFYTINAAEHSNAVTNFGYADEGIACFVHSAAAAGPAPLYRAWNPSHRDHFYTLDATELSRAVNMLGYRAEGVQCYIFATAQSGSVPLFRMLSPSTGDHFYTVDVAERNNAIGNLGYSDEGICGFLYPAAVAGLTPLYRLFEAFDSFIDMNVICVASDTYSNTQWTKITTAVQVMRSIYREVGLNVRNVGYYSIPSTDAGGYVTIDNGGEAEDLTGDWTVPNGGIDVFCVPSMIGADGRSPVDGPCDKDSKGWSGSVVSQNGDSANVGNTFAHEVGHYLGLNHVPENGNFIGGDGSSDSWTGIFAWQGSEMKKHCFVHRY